MTPQLNMKNSRQLILLMVLHSDSDESEPVLESEDVEVLSQEIFSLC